MDTLDLERNECESIIFIYHISNITVDAKSLNTRCNCSEVSLLFL